VERESGKVYEDHGDAGLKSFSQLARQKITQVEEKRL
jgi:hypothetical protein